MGLETLVFVALQAASAGYTANRSNKRSKQAKGRAEEQVRVIKRESEVEAERLRDRKKLLLAKQSVAYSSSGIGLGGSAQDIFSDTDKQYDSIIDSIKRSGAAQSSGILADISLQEGLGRDALVGSLFDVAATGVSAYGAKQSKAKSSNFDFNSYFSDYDYGYKPKNIGV